MTEEARLVDRGHGLVPEGPGWFVVNAADARWRRNAKFGAFCDFEGDLPFPHFGVNVHVLEANQPACHYHHEGVQEAFLVLSGTCRLIVEGEERALKPWDFFYCAPGTKHVFVGGPDGPCAILMMGLRGDQGLFYPRNELAASYGASASRDTDSPQESYAGLPRSEESNEPWPLS